MSPRRLALVAAALAAIAIVSRIPFATHELWQWDSVLYSRALEEGFHVDSVVPDARPHPPGYIFYVALGALFRLVTGDSNAALVAVSICGTAVAIAALFLFAVRFAGRGPAALATLGLAFSPLVWLYGEVAYPYTILGALAVILAAAFYGARAGGARDTLLASALFGLAAGFRQDLLILFAPLWLWMVWPLGWRDRLRAAGAVAVASLAWFVPSALLSGGLGEYTSSVLAQSGGVGTAYSVPFHGVDALSYNARFTVYGILWGLFGFGLVLAVLALAHLVQWTRRGRPAPRLSRRATFLAIWILPPLAFYVVVHIGEWGYLLSILPALYLLVAILLPEGLWRLDGTRRVAWGALAGGLVAIGALAFVSLAGRFSADSLALHDRAIASEVAYVRENFRPEATIVLAREDYLHVRYYLSEYRAWYYDPDPYAKNLALHKKTPQVETTVVLFTQGLGPERPEDVRRVTVADGVQLVYFVVEPGTVFEFNGTRFRMSEGASR